MSRLVLELRLLATTLFYKSAAVCVHFTLGGLGAQASLLFSIYRHRTQG